MRLGSAVSRILDQLQRSTLVESLRFPLVNGQPIAKRVRWAASWPLAPSPFLDGSGVANDPATIP